MFDFIRGTLVSKAIPYLVVEVGGIGYRLEAPLSVCEKFAEGDEVQLFTHMVMRNEVPVLLAFATTQQRIVFTQLIGVSGVGPKLGLSILSTFSIEQISTSLQQQDITRLKSVPGLGEKTARRLVAELSDADITEIPRSKPDHQTAEAIEALIYLGYKRGEATKIIQNIQDPSLTTEQLVHAALQKLQPS